MTVEWNTSLQSFEQDGSSVQAVLKHDNGKEVCEAAYLCGCDGAPTVVRPHLGISFPGDAGYLHSPAGGQGMNTGIGDAVNLSWKLANVIQGRAGEAILHTFETERIAFARKLVETTDRAFQGMVNEGWTSQV